jgi:enterochelin esterase-like enzyme
MRRALLAVSLLAAVPARPAASQPSFDALLRRVEAVEAAARPALVDAFVAGVRAAGGAPLVEDDTTAVVLYRGGVESASLHGDMTDWAEPVPMARVPGTDLFFYRVTVEPDARLEYRIVTPDAPFGMRDPLNPHAVGSGIGAFSELAMPGYAYPEVFAPVRDGTLGGFERVVGHTVPAGALPYAHEVHVYTPPGYHDGAGAYPSVYFQDGRDYVEFAHVPRLLDALVAAGDIAPVVAVFVTPPNRFQPEAPNRTTEYGLNDAYVAFVADELVPFVEARYRTSRDPTARLVVGDSYGGLISTYIAFRRPDVFGLAYSQSGYHSFQADRMLRLLEEAPVAPVRLYADVGTYERVVGFGWLPEAERDFTAANRRLRDVLARKGYDAVYAEYPEGHTWGNWRAHLIPALTHFFGAAR